MNVMEKEIIKVAVVAASVIKKDGKYLLVQEKQPKVYGLWNLPAGRVDVGDTIEQTAIREAKEESGFDVKLISKIDIYQDTALEDVRHAFRAEIVGGEMDFPEDEMLDAHWFSFAEIEALRKSEKLRSKWMFDAISAVEKMHN